MVNPAEYRAAAEQSLADADGHHDPTIPLMRGLVHPLLALTEQDPRP